MIEFFKKLRSRFTMQRTKRGFTDIVSGNYVFYWVDCYGDCWMAESRWGHRVLRTDTENGT